MELGNNWLTQQQKIAQFILLCTSLNKGQSILAVMCNEMWDSREKQPHRSAVIYR